MSKLASQWVELFRAGKYPQGEFTAADLDEIVANYNSRANSDFEEAPSTIGHPEGSAPAWSWWERLKREGTSLWGQQKDVQPEFEEMVAKRLFPKRSVGLVKRASGWNLHHVAWLGAQAPQVKSLADCKFEDAKAVVQVEFEESEMTVAATEATFWEKLTARIDELVNGKKSGDGSAQFSEADVKRIAGEAAASAIAPIQATLTATEARLAASEAKFSTRETALLTGEVNARSADAIAKLKSGGKWIPAFDKMGLPLVFAALAAMTATVEFGEGAEKKQVTPLDMFANFMDSLPKFVPAGVVFDGKRSGATAGSGMKGVNAGRGGVDENSVRLHEAAVEFMEKNKVPYTEAVMKVADEHPELAVPGGAAVGQV